MDGARSAPPGFASAQDEYSLLKRGAEKDLIPP